MIRSPQLPFAKMNGAGNSILVVDERGTGLTMTGDIARRIARDQIGFDQMMVIDPTERAGFDASVRIFNTDGSRAGACGNGTRCVAWVMLDGGAATSLRLDIEASDVWCSRVSDRVFAVDMGQPRFGWDEIPLGEPSDTRGLALGAILDESGLPPPTAVNMGNPHVVFFVPDAGAIDLAALGPRLERHPLFPERANISFAEVLGRDRIRLRVWERGAGATLACGSAACATLVAAARCGRTDRQATLSLPGGDLGVLWREDGHVVLSGPVELEGRGMLTLPELALP